ncbi:helix-turn-helix transcriptional regulator [Bacillus sp. AFS053548]|uniref:helix-turn-helix domain-containing protein n=1 Tax=Bacillus sp. AFS053548 TaxID=2033505 RepID=UPI000BFB228D|nr:helix-turn-helix transcriptional regulator [Bacillus sp. AFS053548]PGM48853.1 hypothetical protein CN946_22975 [Bacillus sp. AFS053548]
MIEGQIIRYYRQKLGLTLEQLGKGICTLAYLSKIELGQTIYSSEIVELLSNRLNIDINNEVNLFKNTKDSLNRWQKAIFMQNKKEVEELKKALKKNPYLDSTEFAPLYQLLRAKYYILKKEFERVYTILSSVEKEYPVLPQYEKNLQLHVWGIYYTSIYDTSNSNNKNLALNILKKINMNEYKNPEYYYNLAEAYHLVQNKMMAYVYAEKALVHFKEMNNLVMMLEAEALMLAQIQNDQHADFEKILESYKSLIHLCDLLHETDKKVSLLGNLSNLFYCRKDYVRAQEIVQEALDLVDKKSIQYVRQLRNYLVICLEGKLMKKTEMLKIAQQGLVAARKLDNLLHQKAFKMLIYRIEDNIEQYYKYIEQDALPYFQSMKYSMWINKYAKELYSHYIDTEQYEKVAKISNILVEVN